MGDDRVQLSPNAFDLFTGTDEDKVDLLKLHRDYLDANTNNLDADLLRSVWSSHPSCVFFNGTGYAYYGIEDWLQLWEHFRPRLKIVKPWCSQDVRLVGNGEVAAVLCDRTTISDWVGPEEAPPMMGKLWVSRSTEVFIRENGAWKCAHVHISTAAEGKRFDQRSA